MCTYLIYRRVNSTQSERDRQQAGRGGPAPGTPVIRAAQRGPLRRPEGALPGLPMRGPGPAIPLAILDGDAQERQLRHQVWPLPGEWEEGPGLQAWEIPLFWEGLHEPAHTATPAH